MQFLWHSKKIEWFINASDYTGFHDKLAQCLLPFVKLNNTVCDFGCGLGLLDIKLSSYVKHIHCVDVSQKAIRFLQAERIDKNIQNMRCSCQNTSEITRKYDVGIMSFFGRDEEDILHYHNLCQKKLIKIVNMENKSDLYPKNHRTVKKETAELLKQRLVKNNMLFEFISPSIEFGQPLRSFQDGRDYIALNAPNATLAEIDDFLNKNTQSTGQPDFPLYLPNLKQLGIFIIS